MNHMWNWGIKCTYFWLERNWEKPSAKPWVLDWYSMDNAVEHYWEEQVWYWRISACRLSMIMYDNNQHTRTTSFKFYAHLRKTFLLNMIKIQWRIDFFLFDFFVNSIEIEIKRRISKNFSFYVLNSISIPFSFPAIWYHSSNTSAVPPELRSRLSRYKFFRRIKTVRLIWKGSLFLFLLDSSKYRKASWRLDKWTLWD